MSSPPALLLLLGIGLASAVPAAAPAHAQGPDLPPLAKMRDANNNNRIERNEAAGPLAPSFDEIDCDKSGGLDGDEIRGFFSGAGCKESRAPSGSVEPKPANTGVAEGNEFLFNLYLPRTSAMFVNIVRPWADAVAAATGGKVRIKYSASSLAPVNRQLRMVATGVADSGMGVHHFTRRRTVTARVSELPFAARSSRAASIAAWRTVRKFAKPSEYKGVELVGVVSPPPTLIFNSRKPIEAIADFRSLKFLAVGSLVLPAKLLGAPVVTIPLPFAYEQFSRGVVDATFSNFGGIVDFRLLEFVKHATPVPGGVGNTSIFLVINAKKFAGLRKRERDAIASVSGEAFGKYAEGWDRYERDAARDAMNAGIAISGLPDETMTELRKRWAVIEPQWIADANKLGIDGESAVAFYRKELARVEEQR